MLCRMFTDELSKSNPTISEASLIKEIDDNFSHWFQQYVISCPTFYIIITFVLYLVITYLLVLH